MIKSKFILREILSGEESASDKALGEACQVRPATTRRAMLILVAVN